jgi:hypothetical protein
VRKKLLAKLPEPTLPAQFGVRFCHVLVLASPDPETADTD